MDIPSDELSANDHVNIGVLWDDRPLTWGEYVAHMAGFLHRLRSSFEEFGRGFFVSTSDERRTRVDDDFGNLEAVLAAWQDPERVYQNVDPVRGGFRPDTTCVLGFSSVVSDADTSERSSVHVFVRAGNRVGASSVWALFPERAPTLPHATSFLKELIRSWNATSGDITRVPYRALLDLQPNLRGVGPVMFYTDAQVVEALSARCEREPFENGVLLRVPGLGDSVPASSDEEAMAKLLELTELLAEKGVLEHPEPEDLRKARGAFERSEFWAASNNAPHLEGLAWSAIRAVRDGVTPGVQLLRIVARCETDAGGTSWRLLAVFEVPSTAFRASNHVWDEWPGISYARTSDSGERRFEDKFLHVLPANQRERDDPTYRDSVEAVGEAIARELGVPFSMPEPGSR